jgi:hypothetical protein
MLNNMNNFFATIKSKMVKKELVNSDLIPIGTKDSRYDGGYSPTAITVENFIAGLPQSSEYTEVVKELTSTQILTLGTPIELLQAPGAGKYYIIDRVQLEYTFNTTAYVFPTSPTFYLDGCFDAYIQKKLLEDTQNTVCVLRANLRNTITVGAGSGSVQVLTNRDVLNSNLIIGTPNGDNPTNGDGTLKIKIYYKIETI